MRQPENIFKVYIRRLFDLIPGQCLACGLPSSLHQPLCPHCHRDLPRHGGRQCRCGLPARDGARPWAPTRPACCRRCRRAPGAVDRIWSAFRYERPLDHLTGLWKHRELPAAGHILLDLWRDSLPPRPEGDQVRLVPVPLHWRRQLRRGFNPALRLARAAAEDSGLPCTELLQRHRATRSQQGLNARQRRRNLDQAFRLRQPVAGLHLILVDDVITTGSTVEQLARLLKQAGAARVEAWSLARTL